MQFTLQLFYHESMLVGDRKKKIYTFKSLINFFVIASGFLLCPNISLLRTVAPA